MIGNQIAGFFSVGTPPAPASNYESIATVTLSGSQSSITFSSIPSTYNHLQIRAIARSDRGSWVDQARFTFNSDTGSNYAYHYVQGESSVSAYGASSQTFGNNNNVVAGGSAGGNIFGSFVMDILDYKSTSKYKTVRSLGGIDADSISGISTLASSLWMNTSAINTINIYGIGNFQQYSTFALYGITGA